MKNTVGWLKSIINSLDVPDNTPLVVDGGDHSYRLARAAVREAWVGRDGEMYEYYGPEYAGEGPGKVIKVIHFGG